MTRELFLRDLSLWDCLWQSVVFLALGLAAGWWLRHRPSRAYAALLLAMMAAALVPFLSAVVRHSHLGAFPAAPEEAAHVLPYPSAPVAGPEVHARPALNVSPPVVSAEPGPSPSAPVRIPWRALLLSAWLAATLLLIGRLVATFVSGARLVRRAQRSGCEEIQQAAERTASRFQLTHGLQIRASDRIRSPVVWCWTRPPVVLVPRVLGHPDVDWTGVVAHELAHCKRWDHVTGLIAELTASLLPWNPLMWLARRSLIRLGEQACDDWVVASGQPSEDYAEALLRFRPQKQMAFWPAVVSNKTGLAHRIRRILNDSCGNPRTGAKWTLALGIMTICTGVGLAFAQTRPAPSEVSANQDEKPAKSLHQAAQDGDIAQVRLLISAGTNVNEKDKDGRTALQLAVRQAHRAVVELLITKGADIEAKGGNGATPLHMAASAGHKDIVELLLNRGADVNVLLGASRLTPLHNACRHGHAEVAELLIHKGARLDATDKGGYPPLYYALWYEHNQTTRVLVAHGADVNFTPKGDWPPLFYVLSSNDQDLIDLLLSKGVRAPALHLAAFKGDLTQVRSICAEGTDINARDDVLNWTPLHWAVSGGQKDIAEFLILKGAEVNARGKDDYTPLLQAAYVGSKESVELLLSHGAAASIGKPLHGAAKRGHVQVLEALIAHGADLDAKDKEGRTPLMRACENSQKGVSELLIAKGADLNVQSNAGHTALHIACATGQKDVVELLIAKGAEVNVKEKAGRSPLVYARDNDYPEIANLLRKHGAKE
jgi:ankyrin repeat protein/beta-lactamase regulating signal transducer with metallopeptidase domain